MAERSPMSRRRASCDTVTFPPALLDPVAMFDLDGFKAIKDTSGHDTADWPAR